ncbi:Nonribosomal peptide synthetase 12 [Penicillium subrubescens]|uniref:Nonribosomal peptide synthetase 12 n=1 Tax=Penicillium subrubescens TaxID=1316194 RepID=A0A1Q5U2N4_9EURO|nr:Nonribosomal peptide synthetase 12 [Penicillium subrubescens]
MAIITSLSSSAPKAAKSPTVDLKTFSDAELGSSIPIPLLSTKDGNLMRQWNAQVPSLVNRCVHELIADRCDKQADAIAVHAWDGEITYAQLHELSSSLARHIIAHDFGAPGIIPLIFEKSIWTTIALLGVMKAGGAFLLIDPAHPVSRLREICAIARVKLVIASQQQTDLARKLVPDVITLGENEPAIMKASLHGKLRPVSPEIPAYCVFTSGSTGKPKGFCVQHDAFATMAATVPVAMGLNATSRVFQFASYAFDASVFEHLACLVMGGTLCVPSDSARSDSVTDAINEFQANFTILTPSVARILSPTQMPSLRTLVMTGEPMRKEDVDKWSSYLQLVNGYGPSECAVCCCVHSSVNSTTELGQIGRPLGACLWLVDPDDLEKIVPVGAVGEILIEGHTVGKGYLSDRDRTTAAFVDAPKWLAEFRLGTSRQVYKTGDLAEYRPDGTLRLLGRKDSQVKIRGQRVELVDVEQKLRMFYPQSTEVVVEAIDTNRTPMLIAFVSHQSSADTSDDGDFLCPPNASFYAESQAARNTLAKSSPNYMIPSIFFLLAYLPTIITGKVDRRRLRIRAEALSPLDRAKYKNPSATFDCSCTLASPTEDALKGLWAQVLSIAPDMIGPKHDFLELGGSSIDAMKLAALCQKEGFAIRVASILAHSGLQEMSLVIENHRDQIASPLPSYKLDHNLRDTLIRDRLISEMDVIDVFRTTEFQRWNLEQPCDHLTIELPADVDIKRLEDAWRKVIARHAALRTVFILYQNQILQVVLKGWKDRMEFMDVQEEIPPVIEGLIREKCRQFPPAGTFHFHLTFLSSPTSRVLLVRINHAQYDGISLGILYNDFMSAYSGRELAVSEDFSDYMRVRHAQSTPEAFDYWRKALDNATMTVLSQSQPTLQRDIVIHAEDLARPLPPKGITLATLLTSAWAWTLAASTGQSDIVFGYVSSGRDVPMDNAAHFVGSAVTTVPMRLTLQRSWTISDLLGEVQNKRILTAPYEVIDFEDIVSQSTSWPAGTQIGSVFSYEDFGEVPEISLDGVHCLTKFHFQKTPTVPYALVSPKDGMIGVRVAGRTDFLSRAQAMRLCGMICTTAKYFSLFHERHLPWEQFSESCT